MKVLNKNLLNNLDLENIQYEIEIQKDLDHPNILKLYDYKEENNYIYLLLEFTSGGDLYSKMKSGKNINLKKIKSFYKQIE